MILAADVDHTVDQKKRIAVRQQPEDFCNIRDTRSFVAHHSSPIPIVQQRGAVTLDKLFRMLDDTAPDVAL